MRVVLFDLDGTLIDSGPLYFECYRRALCAELDPAPSWDDLLERRPTSERHFLLDWLGHEVGDRVHRRVCESYEELAPRLLRGFFEGVEPMLEALAAGGVRLGLVTGKSRRAYEATCRTVDLARFFDVVVLEDDVPLPKPDPGGLAHALEVLGAREAVYVGDSPVDLEAARRAGIAGAAALWGRPAPERERAAARLDGDVWALRAPHDLTMRVAP